MLEGLDREICDFFEADPEAVFISQGLSSYERLLAHACSMYYQLRSQSKFFGVFHSDLNLKHLSITTQLYSSYSQIAITLGNLNILNSGHCRQVVVFQR